MTLHEMRQLLISRSAYEARRTCPRKYFFAYLYRGSGFSERRTPFHLAFGIALHRGMEILVSTTVIGEDGSAELDVLTAIDAAKLAWATERPSGSFPPAEPPEEEVLALLEALILGWVRTEAERFFGEYEVVSVEREGAPQPLSPSASLQFRADVVVRSRFTGLLRIINWKTSSAWGDWTDSWTSEVQAFSEAWALERESGEPVEGTVMAGFHKGGLRQTQGEAHFSSPLIWGYKRELNGVTVYWSDTKAPPAPKDKSEPSWKKFPVWKETFTLLGEDGTETPASGVPAWISWLPLHAVAASFMTSEVLVGHPKAVASFIAAAAQEARDDHYILTDPGVTAEDKLAHFIPRTGKFSCGTAAKPACPFFRVCFTDAEIEDLIEAGSLVPRVDHHAKEAP